MAKLVKTNLFLILLLSVASFLRLWKLAEVPVSLFGDELDVGYHAYSILKTGKDYYGNFLPFHFHSIAEWRTPLYLYASVPTVSLFGISALGVRLPAAIFGILNILFFYFLACEIRLKYFESRNKSFEILAAFVLTISPWHIQYSRAGFEVTLLLLFLISGLYFFLKSFDKNWYLYLAAVLFGLMPWVYSTAKLFIPMLIFALGLVYLNELIKINKKHLFGSGLVFVLISLPILYSIFFGGGGQRFSYVSVFSDPIAEEQIGLDRGTDFLNNFGTGRLFHNKYVVWAGTITNNFLKAYSSDFLFINGDSNPRHSIENMGEFYKVDILPMVIGLILFFTIKNMKVKLFLGLWLVLGVIPSSITQDGGNHATRLILILPPLVLLISYGLYSFAIMKSKILRISTIGFYLAALLVLFIHYQHQFWIHSPQNSARWWHYGWEEAIDAVKLNEENYDKVIISTADEPPWIFFAAWYEYPPEKWQAEFPLDNKVMLSGFGEVSHINKFYFGSPQEKDIYNYGKVLDSETLYLASAKEVGPNLIKEPERVPLDLTLIQSVAYPSGEPAFYLFSRRTK